MTQKQANQNNREKIILIRFYNDTFRDYKGSESYADSLSLSIDNSCVRGYTFLIEIIIAKDYKLNVWLSEKSFKSKPITPDYMSMRWNEITPSLEYFDLSVTNFTVSDHKRRLKNQPYKQITFAYTAD